MYFRFSAIIAILLLTANFASTADDQCPKEQEHDWSIEKLLRHEVCNKFYKCTFGEPVPMRCPGDLFFNLDKWQCDWQHNVDCTDRIIPEEYLPTTTTTTTTSTTPAPTTTTTPAPTTTTTPAPTTTTTTTTTTTPAPTTTTTTTTQAPTTANPDFHPNGCPINPHIHWLLPHEHDCNLFYYCVWGNKELRKCPNTTHFNRFLQVCDYPYRAGCSFNKHLTGRRVLLSNG